MKQKEFTFNAAQLHKSSEYYYNVNMAEKYSNLVTLICAEVKNGNFGLAVSSRDLTEEVISWLHNDLGFNFSGIPRAQCLESNNWKPIQGLPNLDKYEWIKIKW